MKSPLLIAVALAFALPAGLAAAGDETAEPSRFFEAYDRNGDGRVTPDEIPVEGEVFKLLDRDGNGAITPDDLGVAEGYKPRTRPEPTPAGDVQPNPAEPGQGDRPDRGGANGRRGEGRGRRLDWTQMDADGDEKISAEEFKGPPAFFERLDANGDGFIDATEQEQAKKRGRQGPGQPGQPGQGRGGDRGKQMLERISAMDKDGDGRVSAEEWQGRFPFERIDRNGDGFLDAKDFQRPEGQPGGQPGGRPGGPQRNPYASMDTNGDGKITKDEYTGPIPFEQLDKNHDDVLDGRDLAGGRAGRGGQEGRPDRKQMKQALKEMDANGDGKVTKDEYTGPVPFERLDVNGDGALTKEDRPAGRGGDRRRDPEAVKKHFERMDKDGNGALSGDEIRRPEMLEHLDADSDGSISLEEFQAGIGRGREGRPGRGGRDKSPGAPVTEPDGPPPLADLDKDGNGKLSRNEFPGPDDAWRRLDRNRDGWVTQDEHKGDRPGPRRRPQGTPPPQDD